MRLDSPELVALEYADARALSIRSRIWSAPGAGDVYGKILELVKEMGAQRVLEVGCGEGALALRLTRALPDLELVTTDSSEEMLRVARSAGVPAEHADIQELPYPSERFDAVVAAFCLYHVPDVDRGLSQLARVLRSGGALIASVMNDDHLSELWRHAGRPSQPEVVFGHARGAELLGAHFERVERLEVRGALVFPDDESAREFVGASLTSRHLAATMPRLDGALVTQRSFVVFVAHRA